jgi:hypothetical protein
MALNKTLSEGDVSFSQISLFSANIDRNKDVISLYSSSPIFYVVPTIQELQVYSLI